jgi:hypothetical protein
MVICNAHTTGSCATYCALFMDRKILYIYLIVICVSSAITISVSLPLYKVYSSKGTHVFSAQFFPDFGVPISGTFHQEDVCAFWHVAC